MVSIRTPNRTGPKTAAGLQRCRTVRLSHGKRTREAYALRRAYRDLRRAQAAAWIALRQDAPDVENKLAIVTECILNFIGVVDGGTTPVTSSGIDQAIGGHAPGIFDSTLMTSSM